MPSAPVSSNDSSISRFCRPIEGNGESAAKTHSLQVLRASVRSALGVDSSSHGLRGIAEAIRDKLANESSPDAASGILQTIDDALESAGKALADQGVGQANIDAAMKQFRAKLAREIDSLAQPSAPAAADDGSISAIAARQVVKERFSLDILTAENDRVSIRFRSTDVAAFSAAQATGSAGTVIAADAQVISRGAFKIEVTGNLNEAERAAIGDLLDKVDGIAKEFFDGDVRAAFEAASRVGLEGPALTAFSLKLSYSRSTAFARQYADTAAAAEPVATKAANVKLPPAATGAVAEAPVAATEIPAAPEPAPTSPVVASPAPSASSTIANFAKSVLARLDSVSDAGALRFTMRWKVDFLMTAISAASPAQESARPAVTALGDTLNEAVAS